MAKKKAMGTDPLDWIGKGPLPRGNGSAFGSDEARRSREEIDPPLRSHGRDADADSGREPGPSQPSEPPPPETKASPDSTQAPIEGLPTLPVLGDDPRRAIEREILLFDDDRPRLRSRGPSRALLLLVVLFTFVGSGLYLFHKTDERWQAQLDTFQDITSKMERERQRADLVVSEWMASRESLLDERSRTIEELREENARMAQQLDAQLGDVKKMNADLRQWLQEWRDRQEEALAEAKRRARAEREARQAATEAANSQASESDSDALGNKEADESGADSDDGELQAPAPRSEIRPAILRQEDASTSSSPAAQSSSEPTKAADDEIETSSDGDRDSREVKDSDGSTTSSESLAPRPEVPSTH